ENKPMNTENLKVKRGRPKQEVTLTKKIEVRCLPEEKEHWQSAAKLVGASTSDFSRDALNKEAARVIRSNRLKNRSTDHSPDDDKP
ncbi:MAG: DUF1778 domain-containing protein, partial [Endozoicomonadaceae bacterium]|nr:DUF1778 domain-containing protein [Endozoicomonadaceae bacterium]